MGPKSNHRCPYRRGDTERKTPCEDRDRQGEDQVPTEADLWVGGAGPGTPGMPTTPGARKRPGRILL